MKNALFAVAVAAALLTPPFLVSAAPATAMSAQTTPAYFSAYSSLEMERDDRGILLVTLNTKGGPLTFTAKDHTDFRRCLLSYIPGSGYEDRHFQRRLRRLYP